MQLHRIAATIFVPLTLPIFSDVTLAEPVSEDNTFLISSGELFLHSKTQDYDTFALPLAINKFSIEQENKASFSDSIKLTNNHNYSPLISGKRDSSSQIISLKKSTKIKESINNSTFDSDAIAANPKLDVNNSSVSELATCQISQENSNDIKAMEGIRPLHLANNNGNLSIAPNFLESSQKQITNLKSVSCQASDLFPEPNFAIKLQAFDSQIINQDQLVALDSLSSSANNNSLMIHQSSINPDSITILNSEDSKKISNFLLNSQLAQTEESNPPQSAGGDGDFSDASAMAAKSSNPLGGDFIILLNQFDNYFLEGDAIDGTSNLNVWSLQPVVSIPMKSLGEDWIWVTRPTFPFIFNTGIADKDKIQTTIDSSEFGLQPGSTPTFPPSNIPGGVPLKSVGGFGDIVVFSLLGQSIPTENWGGGDIVWGLGPTFSFPTASRGQLGSGKWSIGPSAVGAFIGQKFIIGGLMQNWFSVGGDSKREDVSFSWLNIFYFLNFDDGWQIGGTPIITADWNADGGNQWTVPIGLGVYKTQVFDIGKGKKMPIKFGLEFQYMVVRPETVGQEWNIRVTFAPILPSPFASKPAPTEAEAEQINDN